jgi:hypothetical protein
MNRSSLLKAGVAVAATATVITGGAVIAADGGGSDSAMSPAWEASMARDTANMSDSNDTARATQKERKAEAKRKAAVKRAAEKKAAAKKAAAERAASAGESGRSSSSSLKGGTPAQNRALGIRMCRDRGWSSGQCDDLVKLWNKESGWDHRAYNSSSGATGIPQALPGSKMASKGSDWRTNPRTQIAWGLDYIASTYGSPSNAWAHSQSTGWY